MSRPYQSGREHLADELARIDLLVKSQTRRWRETIAVHKTHGWGMAYVDAQEVDRYLDSEFRLEPAVADPAPDRSQIDARLEASPVLPLGRLVEAFGLSAVERDVLLLALLPELDSRYRRLYGYLLDDGSQWAPVIGLLDEMLAPTGAGTFAARAVLEPGRPLVDHHLVVRSPWSVADGPARRSVRVDDRIVAHLLGSVAVDGRLAGAVEVRPGDGASERGDLLRALHAGGGARVVLGGADLPAYRRTAAAIAADLDRPLVSISAAAAAGDDGPLFVRLAAREGRLFDAVLFWHGCEALFDRGRPVPLWEQVLVESARYPGISVFDHAAPWDPEGRAGSAPMIRWPVGRPGVEDRRRLWLSLLPPDLAPDDAASRLAQSFELSEAQIRDAAATAEDLRLMADPATPAVTMPQLMEACRRQSGRRLLTFTERIAVPPGVTIDNTLVIPDDQKEQLHALVDRVRYRNVLTERHPADAWRQRKGVVALFAGSSGTGKTLAASCVAGELGKDLLRVDLPAVVSKWVGETEKNLQQVFAEAEDANAVMFFDEAESFFAKRGDVRGAQDRWAMMETDYLLQRIEGYTGAVILATNLRQQIDEAFLRRIGLAVEFPYPDASQREELWLRAVSRRRRDLSTDQIASEFDIAGRAQRLALTGADIEAILTDAETEAIAAGERLLTAPHVARCTDRQLRKMGKTVDSSTGG